MGNQISSPQMVYPVGVPNSWGNASPQQFFCDGNRVYFHGAVSTESVQAFLLQLEALVSQKVQSEEGRPRYLEIYLESPGGEVFAGLRVISFIQRIQRETGLVVFIFVSGRWASMGTVIPQQANLGGLILDINAMGMIHQIGYGVPETTLGEQMKAMFSAQEFEKRIFRIYHATIVKRMTFFSENGEPPNKDDAAEVLGWLWRALKNGDYDFPASEALERNLVDFVYCDDSKALEDWHQAVEWYHGWAICDGVDHNGDPKLIRSETRINDEKERQAASQRLCELRAKNVEDVHRIEKEYAHDPVAQAVEGLYAMLLGGRNANHDSERAAELLKQAYKAAF